MPKYSLKILEDKIVIEIDNRRLYFNNFDTNMIFLLFEASGIKGIKWQEKQNYFGRDFSFYGIWAIKLF